MATRLMTEENQSVRPVGTFKREEYIRQPPSPDRKGYVHAGVRSWPLNAVSVKRSTVVRRRATACLLTCETNNPHAHLQSNPPLPHLPPYLKAAARVFSLPLPGVPGSNYSYRLWGKEASL
ncbi:uncharacterized protein LDX57_001322 [Aspergillus melleus]|uniref:uncharacterized protein n=1 Tax=Aspergillus melleus TaxID=138277 RepID=UPI001E8EBE01|nr:uncharacterized protein LDX57_001322 [Aspergillus melleus]KAH8423562.1 hypothetical protein LDX57_001322 [Aspergillus melleus]